MSEAPKKAPKKKRKTQSWTSVSSLKKMTFREIAEKIYRWKDPRTDSLIAKLVNAGESNKAERVREQVVLFKKITGKY